MGKQNAPIKTFYAVWLYASVITKDIKEAAHEISGEFHAPCEDVFVTASRAWCWLVAQGVAFSFQIF